MKAIKIEVAIARNIAPEHWLREPRFARFLKGYEYASTQTQAIPALSKVSPGELFHAVSAIVHGAGLDSDTLWAPDAALEATVDATDEGV